MSLPPQSNTRKIGDLLRKVEAGFSYGGLCIVFKAGGEVFLHLFPRPISSSALARLTHPCGRPRPQ